jgi:hypothetical protein
METDVVRVWLIENLQPITVKAAGLDDHVFAVNWPAKAVLGNDEIEIYDAVFEFGNDTKLVVEVQIEQEEDYAAVVPPLRKRS